MLKLISRAVIVFLLAVSAEATTWYVRTDGGRYGTSSTTCNGQTDSAFTGANGPNCAVNHPFEVLGVQQNNPITQRIAAGDTVIIKNGSYKMGYTAGLYETGWCNPAWPYECRSAPIPSGADAGNKTKIYGEGYASCTTKPQLWGSGDSYSILDLTGTSNVDLRCLDLTDHAECGGNATAFKCPPSSSTSPHARFGIIGYNGANVELHDLIIHGLAFEGIQAGKQSGFAATDVSIYGNAFAGFDQDSPNADDAWSGSNTFTRFKVNWNGCAENYPVDGGYKNCTDQNDTGYGDGWGSPTGSTAGNFTFTDGEFKYNTSDGLDMAYNTDATSLVTVERMLFEGNVGNSVKTRGNKLIIRNTVIISNCGFWADFSAKGPNFSTCRAGGNGIVLDLSGANLFDLVNVTNIGEPDILMEVQGCNGGEVVNIQNSIFQGTTQYGGGDTTSWFYAYNGCDYGTLITTSTAKNNIINGVKEASACTGQTDCSTADPTFVSVNYTTDAFDLRLQSGSPAIDTGLDSGTVVGQTTVPTVDFASAARVADAVDKGAYEYAAGGPPTIVTTSLPNGQVGVAYSQQVTVTGGTTPYTACDETLGALPAGSPAFTSTANGSGCLIAGTPTTVEVASFTERVTDNAAQTDSQALSITVIAAAPTITTTTLAAGVVGLPYSEQALVTGGTTPYTLCDETVGSLPAGSPAFTSTANVSGCLIEGTPTAAAIGTTNFTERVTDSGAQTDTQALSITVADTPLPMTSSVSPGATYVLVRFGFAGLDQASDCTADIYSGVNIVGTATTTSGFATRAMVVTGLTASTSYTGILSCDTPSAEDNISFTTLATPTGGARTVPLQFGAPAITLPGVARLTVEYDDNEALSTPATSQNTDCGSGCTVSLSLNAGLWYYRHKWQTAADAVLATSAVQLLVVQ